MTRDELLHSVAGDTLSTSEEVLALPLKINEEQEIENMVAEYLRKGGRVQSVEPGATGGSPVQKKFALTSHIGPKLAAKLRAEREGDNS